MHVSDRGQSLPASSAFCTSALVTAWMWTCLEVDTKSGVPRRKNPAVLISPCSSSFPAWVAPSECLCRHLGAEGRSVGVRGVFFNALARPRSPNCPLVVWPYLHYFTHGQQVSQSDVIATEEGLPLQKHSLQLVQRVTHLFQCPLQLRLLHRLPGHTGYEHLGGGFLSHIIASLHELNLLSKCTSALQPSKWGPFCLLLCPINQVNRGERVFPFSRYVNQTIVGMKVDTTSQKPEETSLNVSNVTEECNVSDGNTDPTCR